MCPSPASMAAATRASASRFRSPTFAASSSASLLFNSTCARARYSDRAVSAASFASSF
jgi:hypothetical protein